METSITSTTPSTHRLPPPPLGNSEHDPSSGPTPTDTVASVIPASAGSKVPLETARKIFARARDLV